MLVILSSSFIQLLVALKVRYHQRITILRGNHESRQVFYLSFIMQVLDCFFCYKCYQDYWKGYLVQTFNCLMVLWWDNKILGVIFTQFTFYTLGLPLCILMVFTCPWKWSANVISGEKGSVKIIPLNFTSHF